MDAQLIAFQADIAAIQAEVQGMIALNEHRSSRDETLAYDDEAFQEKANSLWAIGGCLRESFRKGYI